MLEVAKTNNSNDRIKYIQMNMTEITSLTQKFDLIYSSLAFHYVENLNSLMIDLYSMLNDDGYLLFSQEHPFVTATIGGKQHYNKDENGNYVSYTFSNYAQPGKRETFWFIDGVVKYHRRFSDIISAICNAGFVIDTVCEPLLDKNNIAIHAKEQIKPTFLIVRAHKKG